MHIVTKNEFRKFLTIMNSLDYCKKTLKVHILTKHEFRKFHSIMMVLEYH